MKYDYYGDIVDSFQIFVDRIEGNYAICEFPDCSMKDIPLSFFQDDVLEQSRYQVFYKENGELEYLFRIYYISGEVKENNIIRKLSKRFVRF